MSSTTGNHPEINSLIRFKDLARDELKQQRYEDLLETLITLIRELRTKDQDLELKDTIKKERLTLSGFVYPSGRKDRIGKMRSIYEEWYESVIQILWTKNYLVNESYGMYYPAEN